MIQLAFIFWMNFSENCNLGLTFHNSRSANIPFEIIKLIKLFFRHCPAKRVSVISEKNRTHA